jgi:hypothetical protein
VSAYKTPDPIFHDIDSCDLRAMVLVLTCALDDADADALEDYGVTAEQASDLFTKATALLAVLP